MPEKKILVVGGAGFIGSHVNDLLAQAGYETIIFDNLSRGDVRSVLNGQLVCGDLNNEASLDKVFTDHKFAAVMHFAAFTDVGESVLNPCLYYQNNVWGTIQLVKCMVKHRVLNLIFSSSAAVYGIPFTPSIEENSICQPINPYGRTKWMAEQILQDFEAAYGLQYCSLRYFNAAGGDPNGKIGNYKSKENNLIPLALRSLLNPQGSITVFGNDYDTPDGTCIRDYIHVLDLGSAHILAMEALFKGAPSAFYNLGNGNGFSVNEVLNTVEKVTGRELNIVQGKRRPGDPAILIANAKKARLNLSWHPQYFSLEEMISHAWKALNKEASACIR